MPRGVGTRMTGHPDIEPISKVTTGEGSEVLLLATPPASWAGGGGSSGWQALPGVPSSCPCHLKSGLRLTPGLPWHFLG